MTPEQLKAIEERSEKASPGPWSGILRKWLAGESVDTVPRDDIIFLSHAREDIPALISEVKRLNQMLNKQAEKMFQMSANNAHLREALEHITALAGNPDAAEACRLIIKRVREALDASRT